MHVCVYVCVYILEELKNAKHWVRRYHLGVWEGSYSAEKLPQYEIMQNSCDHGDSLILAPLSHPSHEN